MGEQGWVRVHNCSGHNWTRIHQHSYQMEIWNFPEKVRSSDPVISVKVEFEQGLFMNEGDDAGEARYQLDGTDKQFELQARRWSWSQGFTILAQNISIPRNEWGNQPDQRRLGWENGGSIAFTLPGWF